MQAQEERRDKTKGEAQNTTRLTRTELATQLE